jgi:hypothetical protein
VDGGGFGAVDGGRGVLEIRGRSRGWKVRATSIRHLPSAGRGVAPAVGVAGAGVWRRLWRGGWRPRMERNRGVLARGWKGIAACSRADGNETRGLRVEKSRRSGVAGAGVMRRIWRGGWRPRMERIATSSCAEGNESRRARGGQNRDVWTPTLTTYRVVEIIPIAREYLSSKKTRWSLGMVYDPTWLPWVSVARFGSGQGVTNGIRYDPCSFTGVCGLGIRTYGACGFGVVT